MSRLTKDEARLLAVTSTALCPGLSPRTLQANDRTEAAPLYKCLVIRQAARPMICASPRLS